MRGPGGFCPGPLCLAVGDGLPPLNVTLSPRADSLVPLGAVAAAAAIPDDNGLIVTGAHADCAIERTTTVVVADDDALMARRDPDLVVNRDFVVNVGRRLAAHTRTVAKVA